MTLSFLHLPRKWQILPNSVLSPIICLLLINTVGEGNGNPSSTLAWRIPGTAEPGGLPSMCRTESDTTESDLAAAAAASIL